MTSSVTVLGFTSDLVLWQILVLTVVSLFVGVLGGFLGLALGTIRLPALLLMGVAPPIAAGTNILVSTVAALSGSASHLREGRVILRVVAMMGIPSVIGAFAGGSSAARRRFRCCWRWRGRSSCGRGWSSTCVCAGRPLQPGALRGR